MKCRDVLNGISECALAWVEPGRTFRDLDEAERAAARSKRAREEGALLPLAEVHGLQFKLAAARLSIQRQRRLAAAARLCAAVPHDPDAINLIVSCAAELQGASA